MPYYVSGRITAGCTLMLRITKVFPIGAGILTLSCKMFPVRRLSPDLTVNLLIAWILAFHME